MYWNYTRRYGPLPLFDLRRINIMLQSRPPLFLLHDQFQQTEILCKVDYPPNTGKQKWPRSHTKEWVKQLVESLMVPVVGRGERRCDQSLYFWWCFLLPKTICRVPWITKTHLVFLQTSDLLYIVIQTSHLGGPVGQAQKQFGILGFWA